MEDIEFIKILANSDSTILQKGMNSTTKNRLDSQIGTILREYYQEKTMNAKKGWIEKFEKVGITEDDGKKVALLPGGFKPPHAGHYRLAKELSGIGQISVRSFNHCSSKCTPHTFAIAAKTRNSANFLRL